VDLQSLFSSEERLRILDYVMLREGLRVTEISRELGVSKGLVSEYMRTLRENGLVTREGHGYSPKDNFATRGLKRLLNLSKFDPRKVDTGQIRGIGLYGSWARGTNTVESDVDVWVKADAYPPQEYLAELSSRLRRMFGSEIRLLVLTPDKEAQVAEDEVFHSSLLRDSVLLWGEDIA
jgi:predicted nucleotidyltransferase